MKIGIVLIVSSCLFATAGAFVSVAPAKQSTGSVLFYDSKGDAHHVEKHDDVRSKVAEWIEQQMSRLEPRDVMPKGPVNQETNDDVTKWLSDTFVDKDPILDNWFNHALTQEPPTSLKGLQIEDNEEAKLKRKSFQGLSPEAPETIPLSVGSIKNFHLEPTDQKTLTQLSTNHVVKAMEALGDGMWFSQTNPAPVQKEFLGNNDSQLKPGSADWFNTLLNQSTKDDISKWLSDAFANKETVADNWFTHALHQKPSSLLKNGIQIQEDAANVALRRKSFHGLLPEVPKSGPLPVGALKNFHLAPIGQKTLASLSSYDVVKSGENLDDGRWLSQASPAPVDEVLLGSNNNQVKPGCSEWFSVALN